MHIESSAPTRIDLAGGTLDIWPLYLYHEGAQTLNVAISVRARCRIAPSRNGQVMITSEDTGTSMEGADWRAFRSNGEFRLLGGIVHYFKADGLTLATSSDSPVGAGIAGSSALTLAVCAALARWTERELEPDELLYLAMNLEARAIQVPTGVQDYRAALHGGISAIELGPARVMRVALDVDPRELERRLVLAYTGATRQSGINNWEVTKRHVDGDRTVFDRFERIRDIAVAMREALVRHDWREVGRQIAAEWESRKRLAPGVTTPTIDALIARAQAAGAHAAKVCGAGGGGCLVCFADPEDLPAVAAALADGGAQVMDFQIEREGLKVERVD